VEIWRLVSVLLIWTGGNAPECGVITQKKKETGIYTEFVPGDGRLTLIKVERSSGSSPRGGNDKEFLVNRKFSGFIILKKNTKGLRFDAFQRNLSR
jgi:hypothetical protein